jgi:hypothetical protein
MNESYGKPNFWVMLFSGNMCCLAEETTVIHISTLISSLSFRKGDKWLLFVYILTSVRLSVTSRFNHKTCGKSVFAIKCFSLFFVGLVLELFSSDKHLVSYAQNMWRNAHRSLQKVSEFNQNQNWLTNFSNPPKVKFHENLFATCWVVACG